MYMYTATCQMTSTSKHFPLTVENTYVFQPFILQLFPENYIPASET